MSRETELKPCKCSMSVPFMYSTELFGSPLWFTIICVGCRKTVVRARTPEKAMEKWNRNRRVNDD